MSDRDDRSCYVPRQADKRAGGHQDTDPEQVQVVPAPFLSESRNNYQTTLQLVWGYLLTVPRNNYCVYKYLYIYTIIFNSIFHIKCSHIKYKSNALTFVIEIALTFTLAPALASI